VIFGIVRRFWEKLPGGLRKDALMHSRANVRQLVFPLLDSEYRVETADANAGRGMTINYLHCSEVSRWPRDAAETLASVRAAVAPDGRLCSSRRRTAPPACFMTNGKRRTRSVTRNTFSLVV